MLVAQRGSFSCVVPSTDDQSPRNYFPHNKQNTGPSDIPTNFFVYTGYEWLCTIQNETHRMFCNFEAQIVLP